MDAQRKARPSGVSDILPADAPKAASTKQTSARIKRMVAMVMDCSLKGARRTALALLVQGRSANVGDGISGRDMGELSPAETKTPADSEAAGAENHIDDLITASSPEAQ